jgi:mono/diheme cytochrome c family protein
MVIINFIAILQLLHDNLKVYHSWGIKMTKRQIGLFLTLSILILLAACSSTKDKAGVATAPSAAASPLATDAPKASDNVAVSPQATPITPPTAAPQATNAVPATSHAATASATPKSSIAATLTPKPPATITDTATAAAALFKQNCITCHGVELQGGFGPNLQKVGSRLTEEQIINQIHDGGGDMPPFGTRLKAEEIQIIAAWLSAKK